MKVVSFSLLVAAAVVTWAQELPQSDYLPPRQGDSSVPVGIPAVEPPPADPCPQVCPFNYSPICGSDGVTYTNECTFGVATCKNSALTLQSYGECERARPSAPLPPAKKPSEPLPPPVIPYPPPTFDVRGSQDVTFDYLDPDTIPTFDQDSTTCPEACTRIYLPVCGSDGVTYNNQCLLEVAACKTQRTATPVTYAFEGNCETLQDTVAGVIDIGAPLSVSGSSPCPENCDKRFDPVCGSDGTTYNNECILNIAICNSQFSDVELKKAYNGACAPEPTTAYPSAPGALVASRDDPVPPPPASTCPENCNKKFDPVCGSDGETYNNECILNVAICNENQRGVTLTKAYDGACAPPPTSSPTGPLIDSFRGEPSPPVSQCPENCNRKFHPVCGSDGETYNNECILNIAICKANLRGEVISKAHDGQCGAAAPPPTKPEGYGADSTPTGGSTSLRVPADECPEFCQEIYSPICGTDSVTYDNACVLQQTTCRTRAAGVNLVTKAFDGPCVAALPRGPVCKEECDKTFLPVCGSDGETHNNLCLLQLADCLNPFVTITVVTEGPCGVEEDSASAENDVPFPQDFSAPVAPPRSSSEDLALHGGYLPPV